MKARREIVCTQTSRMNKVCIGTMVLSLLVGLASRQVLGDERPTNPDIRFTTLELLSYQDPDYRFQIIGRNETPPPGFEQPGFDDTDFNTGNAGFGGGRLGAGAENCPLQATVETRWRTNSQLLLRRVISVPEGASNVRVMMAVDNDILGVFFNGAPLNTGVIMHAECPILDEFRFDVPQDLVQPGENLLAFHVLDQLAPVGPSNESFFDARVLAELSRGELTEAVDDVTETVGVDLPEVPLTDLAITCPAAPPSGSQRARTLARVAFEVAPTSDAGEIVIRRSRAAASAPPTSGGSQRARLNVSTKFMLEGEVVATARRARTRAVSPGEPASDARARVKVEATVSPSLASRARATVTNEMALTTVFARGRTLAATFDCLASSMPALACAEKARSAGALCRTICGLQSAVVSAVASAAVGVQEESTSTQRARQLAVQPGFLSSAVCVSLCADEEAAALSECASP